MARTKQTARRMAGGKAPRKQLFGQLGGFNNFNVQGDQNTAGGINVVDALAKRLDTKTKESLDKENIQGYTPLILSIKKQWYRLSTQLIKEGFFKKNRVDEYTKLSPLHHAAQANDEEFLGLLIKTFKNMVNAKDMCGNTPLHYAAYYRNKKYIEMLVNEGANTNEKNREGNTPLHLTCLSNDPLKDHSTKVEEFLIDNGADINATNKNLETPIMLLFRVESDRNELVCTKKFDPIASLMVLLKSGADVTQKSKSLLTPLHYACIRGSTISALTLLNHGADCDAQDFFETTPYGYALKNNHEDLCIFLIQQENEVNVPINEVVEDDTHICNQLTNLSNYVNPHEIDDLIEKRTELLKLTDVEQIKEGFKKLRTYSPFYYAIKHNMQGNIYLLLQKGFDQFSALAESIIHNKFNFFVSVLDSVDTKGLKKQTNSDGKNLMHVLAESTREGSVDAELLNEVYGLISSLGVDFEAKDNFGRIPLHYAMMSHNFTIASKLLENHNSKQIVDLCNTTDDEGISAFAMIYHKLSKNSGSFNTPIPHQVITLLQSHNIAQMNPFVKFDRSAFPYTFLSFALEDGVMIHPLILLLESQSVDSLNVTINHFDLDKLESQDHGYTFIDWLFKLGKIRVINHVLFKEKVRNYLKTKANVKKIEEILNEPLKDDVYLNVTRIGRYVADTFGVKLNIKVNVDLKSRHKHFTGKPKTIHDFEGDSEKYLDKEIPRLEKEAEKEAEKKGKTLECVLDSTQPTEKYCLVVKDEEEPGYYFDAIMKKVDIKKYYYGLDNFYALQLLRDEVKKVYIVWTRWGRSGSTGQYQRTPFSKLEDAKREFMSVRILKYLRLSSF